MCTTDKPTTRLVALLDSAAEQRTREYWERYMKGTARFRGVPMAGVRTAVRTVWREQELVSWTTQDLLSLAHRWFAQEMSEDKLAAILLITEHLGPRLGLGDVEALAGRSPPGTSPTGASATGTPPRRCTASSPARTPNSGPAPRPSPPWPERPARPAPRSCTTSPTAACSDWPGAASPSWTRSDCATKPDSRALLVRSARRGHARSPNRHSSAYVAMLCNGCQAWASSAAPKDTSKRSHQTLTLV